LPRFQPGEIAERPHTVCALLKVQQQHVATFNRAFDAGYQHQAAIGSVRREPPQIELTVVQRDGQGVVSEDDSAVDQLERRMRNSVDWIVSGMCVQLNF
jgi:hypothetical protein